MCMDLEESADELVTNHCSHLKETNGADCERTHYKSLQSSSAETANELVTNHCSHRQSGD